MAPSLCHGSDVSIRCVNGRPNARAATPKEIIADGLEPAHSYMDYFGFLMET